MSEIYTRLTPGQRKYLFEFYPSYFEHTRNALDELGYIDYDTNRFTAEHYTSETLEALEYYADEVRDLIYDSCRGKNYEVIDNEQTLRELISYHSLMNDSCSPFMMKYSSVFNVFQYTVYEHPGDSRSTRLIMLDPVFQWKVVAQKSLAKFMKIYYQGASANRSIVHLKFEGDNG